MTSAPSASRPQPTATIRSLIDQHVADAEIADLGIEAEDDPVADQRAGGRNHREVDPVGVERGEGGTLGDAAALNEAPGPAEVALAQLLEIAHLEQDDPHQHQQADDHRAVGG